jgi:hypothetical protein
MVYEADGLRADWAEDVATDLAQFDGRVVRLETFTFEDGVGCHTYSPHCARALPGPRRSTTSSSQRSDPPSVLVALRSRVWTPFSSVAAWR